MNPSSSLGIWGVARLVALVTATLLVTGCSTGGGSGGEIAAAPTTAPAPSEAVSPSAPSTKSSSKPKTFYDAQLNLSLCIRAHGLPGYPDPLTSGHTDWKKLEALQESEQRRDGQRRMQEAMGKGSCGPEYEAAQTLEPPRDPQADYASLLAHAKCMREHDVDWFANPTIDGDIVMPGGNSGTTQRDEELTETYRGARAACDHLLSDATQGMQ